MSVHWLWLMEDSKSERRRGIAAFAVDHRCHVHTLTPSLTGCTVTRTRASAPDLFIAVFITDGVYNCLLNICIYAVIKGVICCQTLLWLNSHQSFPNRWPMQRRWSSKGFYKICGWKTWAKYWRCKPEAGQIFRNVCQNWFLFGFIVLFFVEICRLYFLTAQWSPITIFGTTPPAASPTIIHTEVWWIDNAWQVKE